MKKKIGIVLLILFLAAALLFAVIAQKAREAKAVTEEIENLVVAAAANGSSYMEMLIRKSADKYILEDRVYSHGHTGKSDEHSFEAYDAEIVAGSHNLDLDIVTSAEGTLYISHDLTAYRLTGDGRYYSQMTDEQIDSLKTKVGGSILKLSDVFEHYKDSVHYLIEVKDNSEVAVDAFCKIVDEYGLANHVSLQSKYREVLRKAEKEYPDMRKIMIIKTQPEFDEALGEGSVDELSVKIDYMTEANCKAAHDADKRFSVWPVNTESNIKKAIEMGVDAYFTDDTALALSIEHDFYEGDE